MRGGCLDTFDGWVVFAMTELLVGRFDMRRFALAFLDTFGTVEDTMVA